jgi:transposase
MVDISDDTKSGYRRIELLTGPGRRRRWTVEEKARIIEETLAPGARVSDVARRWQLSSQQVFTWRREARGDRVTKPSDPAVSPIPTFVPIITEASAAPVASAVTSAPPVIEIKLAGAVVRVASGMDGSTLTTVLRAVRASASRR